MPLRYAPAGAAVSAQIAACRCRPPQRSFHASAARRLDANTSSATDHYETLNVHPTASAAEIKKSFYHLSKRHHPDHNPSDRDAPTRFMRISEAYATLSHADRRARYDRDVLPRVRPPPRYQHGSSPGASYHSTGPAGGRPASGLSRRRGTYQGPPPSFYRAGGWGAHGAKRRAAHEESTGGGAAGFASGSGSGSSAGAGGGGGGAAGGGSAGAGAGAGGQPPPPPPPGGGSHGHGHGGDNPPFGSGAPSGGTGTGGMGPGQHYTSTISDEDLPHFDRAAHERAQRRADERRAQKRAAQAGVRLDQPESATTMSFFGAAAILGAVLLGTFALSGGARGRERGGGGRGENEREGGKEREKKGK